MDPIKLLIDNAASGGIVLLAVVLLLIRGDLTLGRETRREREVTDRLLPLAEAAAKQLEILIELAKRRGDPRE